MSEAEERPEIVPVETEREILYAHLLYALEPGKLALRPDLTVAEGWDTIAGMAVTGVIRALRVMSARQLAVLLADEANRGSGYVIREPPHYSPEEIADAS